MQGDRAIGAYRTIQGGQVIAGVDQAHRQSVRAIPKKLIMQTPTRVLLVSLHHPGLLRGGAQQVCYELFQELRQRPDVRVYLCRLDRSKHARSVQLGARITGFDGREDEFLFLSRDYDHWWHKLGEPLLIEAFVEFLKTIRPDVVHFHHFMTFGIDLLTVTRRTLPNCRIIFTFHEFLAICAANGHMVRRTDQSLVRRPARSAAINVFRNAGRRTQADRVKTPPKRIPARRGVR